MSGSTVVSLQVGVEHLEMHNLIFRNLRSFVELLVLPSLLSPFALPAWVRL